MKYSKNYILPVLTVGIINAVLCYAGMYGYLIGMLYFDFIWLLLPILLLLIVIAFFTLKEWKLWAKSIPVQLVIWLLCEFILVLYLTLPGETMDFVQLFINVAKFTVVFLPIQAVGLVLRLLCVWYKTKKQAKPDKPTE